MNSRPDAEDRKDRRARVWVGLGIAILLFSLVGNVLLGLANLNSSKENLNSQNNHHASTVKKDAEILSLLNTVHEAQMVNKGTLDATKALAAQVNNVIAGLPAADAELAKFAAYSIAVNEAVCADIVKVAAQTGIALAACPAVPTFPPLT